MSYRTARSRAVGLGSAKEGVAHWWSLRVTSVALIPLTLLFVFPFARALGSSHEAVLALYANPFHALVAILFIAVSFHHLWQGLQEVIVDYIHDKAVLAAALLANTFFCGAAGLAGVFAVAKIAFTA